MRSCLPVLAPAKVNLYLRVLGRREDGYHELATLFLKLALFDRLEIRPAAGGITLSCPGSDLAGDVSNLVYRAADLFLTALAERRGQEQAGVDIILHKEIPLAAGLGGGSSDAAAVLLALNRIYQAGFTITELTRLGVRLGADVPLFLRPWPCAWGTGIGDRLQPAPVLRGYDLLLVNPGFSVSTKWAFQNFTLTSGRNKINLYDSPNKEQDGQAGCPFLTRPITPKELHNDLEQVTLARYSELEEIRQRLLSAGAAAALMSGSGPTVFGLFALRSRQQAEQCFREMGQRYDRCYLVRPLGADTVSPAA